MPRKSGVPFARDEIKKRWNFSLTQVARDGINRLFKFWGYANASELLEALGRGEIFLSKQPPSLASLLAARDLKEVSAVSDIRVSRLKEFLKGSLPTVNELMDLEEALGVSQEELMQICGIHQRYPEKNDTEEKADEPHRNCP